MTRIAVLDVQYSNDIGFAACVVAESWAAAQRSEERTRTIKGVAEYRPGAFWARELPCLTAVIELVESHLDMLVIDGYVHLDSAFSPGLGEHLWRHFEGSIPVVGIAKSAFHGSIFATPVMRGLSSRPLFVTAHGLPVEQAATHVREMHGNFRIPTLVKRADELARLCAARS